MTRPQAMRTAREMYDDGHGWTITEIRRYLLQQGFEVSRYAVHGWVDQEWWAGELERKRRVREVRRGEAPKAVTPELLRALRLDDELSYSAIAKVVSRFYGESMTEDQARYRLYELGAPKNSNKSRANTERQAA
jgi:hypothetical protein